MLRPVLSDLDARVQSFHSRGLSIVMLSKCRGHSVKFQNIFGQKYLFRKRILLDIFVSFAIGRTEKVCFKGPTKKTEHQKCQKCQKYQNVKNAKNAKTAKISKTAKTAKSTKSTKSAKSAKSTKMSKVPKILKVPKIPKCQKCQK